MKFDYSITEAVNSLTGFDMLEIKKRFGAPFRLLEEEIMNTALYYICAHRQDDSYTYDEAMRMSIIDIVNAFKPEDDATFPSTGS